MNEYIGIGCLVIGLCISFWMSKKDFDNWYELDIKDKFYALRAPMIIITGIILLLIKIFKS